MNREEHLKWCKDRAMEYVKHGDLQNAVTSMLSDMGKHEDTRDHPALQLMAMLMSTGHLENRKEVEDFILGFN